MSALGEGVGTEEWLAPGGARLFRFETKGKGKVGLGIQSTSEALDCLITNDAYQPLGDGCQQYLTLDKGAYLLTGAQPAQARRGAPGVQAGAARALRATRTRSPRTSSKTSSAARG